MFWTALATRRPSRPASSMSSALKESGSLRTSESIPIARAPWSSGVASRQRRPSARNSSSSGIVGAAHVAPVDGLVRAQQLLEQRPVDRPARAGRQHLVRAGAGDGHHLRDAVLAQHDRDPVEGQQPAHLADEGVEGLVELERGAERAGAAVGGLERVRAAAELVAQPLGIGRARLGDPGLAEQPQHQPADDQADQHLEPELERDVVEAVACGARTAARAATRKPAITGALAAATASAPTIP